MRVLTHVFFSIWHSYSYRFLQKGALFDFSPGTYNANSNLLYNPTTNKYVIITKGLNFYQSNNVNGPYTLVNNVWPYLWPPLADPNTPNKYKWGGLSIYQEGNDAYLVVSRFDGTRLPETRAIFIYSLTPDYLNLQAEIYWSPNLQGNRREAPWISQKDDGNGGTIYYMTMSHTRGWKPSETYYWTATSLSGPWTDHGQVGMVGSSYTYSHNSQHRYLMKVGNNDQWIFGGDRYHYHEPTIYPEADGQNIMCNVIWDDNFNPPKPIVVFNSSWTVDA